ncbi:HNH endonuclease signature motif containing protein [Kribbella sindirgiensis]|uniref:HNH endonuclease n=1 Tax=Kribbella sindirgiensis TaxID=1124744 RepID=A0A4R0I0F3_9ACTN|nr:HNH endonuclease signature motif containing protein [Kribbella sindirgiensis]TCC15485.1 HNH endonuclease [Kribbella sindirgiensis]
MAVEMASRFPGDVDLAGFAATPRWITACLEKEATSSPGTAQAPWLDAVDPPNDLYDPQDPHAPRFLSEEDLYDDLPPMSRVDGLEWELWAGVEQDEAEREMLRLKAPAWAFLPPGAALAAALESVRPQCESPVALIELMKAASRLVSWGESIKADAIASFVRQRKAQATEIPRPTQVDTAGRPIDPERSWAAEIGAALHLSTNTAARHIDTALHLTGTLTATHTALRCGALTWSKTLAISEATRALDDQSARAVEAHVLRRAAGQTNANLRKSLRTQVAKHNAAAEATGHRAAIADRTCKIVPLADGMAGLWVVHTADKIQQMWIVIQAMADLAKRGTATERTPADTAPGGPATVEPANAEPPTAEPPTVEAPTAEAPTAEPGSAATPSASEPVAAEAASVPTARVDDAKATDAAGNCATDRSPEAGTGAVRAAADGERVRDHRTAEQRRADVVTDVFDHMLHNGLDWLGRRLPDRHRRRPHIEVLIPITTLLGVDDDPCELSGYGPVPAEMARRIARDATWRRLLTDPTNGTVLEASTHRHDPGAVVSETLLARHPVCAWPGCNRTSRECDRDHATPFRQSGRTNLTGLVPYCEYHHVIKDTPAWGWKTTAHPNGSVTLTAPTGHRYTTVPPARGPITQETMTHDPPPF